MTRQSSSTAKGRNKRVVKKPFQIYQHKRRKYVRMEVDSPLKFKVINPPDYDLNLNDKQTCSGQILNISGGGVLMETDYKVREEDYLVMELTLEGADTLKGVIGKVKRVDSDDKEYPLVGVEFMSPEQIKEEMPDEILEKVGEHIFSFDEQLRKMLLKYVFARKVDNA